MIIYTKINFNFNQIKKGLLFSLPLLPGALAFLFLSFSDRVILERSVSMAEIGVYNVAFILASALNIVIQSGYKAIEPEIFKKFGTDGFYDFVNKSKSVFLFLVYAGAMFIALFSQEVFWFMTSESFHKGYLLVPIILIGVVMTGQNVIFGGILIAEKKTKVIGVATIIGAIVSILFNITLIPHFGVYAAAFSSSVSFAIMNYLLFYKMSFKGKNLKNEILALLLFVLINAICFYIFNFEVSTSSTIIKLLMFIGYILILFYIFQIKAYFKVFR